VDYNLGPGRPGAKTGLGWRKKWGRKNPVWPCQKLGCNPLTFVFFFTKITLFWFKKKKNWPGRPGDPIKILNPGLRPGWPPGRVWKLWFGLWFFLSLTTYSLFQCLIISFNTPS
jgi:hypothetical protein